MPFKKFEIIVLKKTQNSRAWMHLRAGGVAALLGLTFTVRVTGSEKRVERARETEKSNSIHIKKNPDVSHCDTFCECVCM